MNPLKKIEGNMIVMLIWSAAFWVWALVEISNPRLIRAKMYSSAARNSAGTAPAIGT